MLFGILFGDLDEALPLVVVGFHDLVIGFEFLKEALEFFACSHGGDFDFRGSPAGQCANFLHTVFFEIEEADDNLLAGFERGDEAVEEGAH